MDDDDTVLSTYATSASRARSSSLPRAARHVGILVDPSSPYHKDVFASGKRLVFTGWRSALATKAVQDMGLERHATGDGTEAGKTAAETEEVEPKRR